MKNSKKVLISVIALITLVSSLASCGKTAPDSTKSVPETTAGSVSTGSESADTGSTSASNSEHRLPELKDVAYNYSYGPADPNALYFGVNKDKGDVFGDMKETVDPAKVYKSIQYEPCMFYGYYKTDLEEFKKTAAYSMDIRYKGTGMMSSSYKNLKVSSCPVEWNAGELDVKNPYGEIYYPGYAVQDLIETTDLDWVVVRFAVEKDSQKQNDVEETVDVVCAYTINGNAIELRMADLQRDAATSKYTYTLSNDIIKYEFEFYGPYLTLKSGNGSVKLKHDCYDDLYLSAYSLPDSKLIGNTDNFQQNTYIFDSKACMIASKRDASYYSYCDIKLCENGLACIKLVGVDEENSTVLAEKQCVYFLTGGGSSFNIGGKRSGFVLTDGKDTYYYYDSSSDRQKRLNDGYEFNSDETEMIEDLYLELATEFANNGIGAFINRQTGEICLDSDVLFAPDQADITEDGKALLDRFAKVYYSVVFSGKYDGFITGMKVEGHAAPVGDATYESGLALSQQRAENVMNYLESNSDGFDLSGKISAEGLSISRPVYNENGEVDLELCRRVAFRFVVNAD